MRPQTIWSDYKRVAFDKLCHEDVTANDTLLEKDPAPETRRWWHPVFHLNAPAYILLAMMMISLILTTMRITTWLDQQKSRPTAFSPLHRMIEISYTEKYLQSGFLANQTSPDDIYRRPNSPEVEKAWSELGEAFIFPITRSDVVRLGKDPQTAVKAPSSWGWPKDSYLGSIEANHQLHCLDTLRRNLLHNYHYYWGSRFGFTPNVVWEYHLTHCLDILRQHLMCTADTSVWTYNFVHGQSRPFGDFSVKKQCVNFEEIMDFNRKAKEMWIKGSDPIFKAPIPRAEDMVEVPPLPEIPKITRQTRWVDWEGGRVPVGPIRGLEGRDYCLGGLDELIV